jgi:hypothetical protein
MYIIVVYDYLKMYFQQLLRLFVVRLEETAIGETFFFFFFACAPFSVKKPNSNKKFE